MIVSAGPPYHLSYHEVLSHFLALKQDNDHIQSSLVSRKARTKAQAKRDYPLVRDAEDEQEEEVLEDLSVEQEEAEKIAERRGIAPGLVWIQDEVIKYLCSDSIPTTRQTEEGVATLADQLQDFGLTKAEVLQCCNSAPTSRVNLYAIIEQPEVRFKPNPEDTLSAIRELIASTLFPSAPDHLQPYIEAYRDPVADVDNAVLEEGDVGMYDEESMMAQEYVTEAAWGAEKEGGVEDERDGEIDS